MGARVAGIDALVFVTQSPDYFLPSTSCLIHKELSLSDSCATFDVGLGCSGYPYGFWLAALMLEKAGFRRALLLHGETPTRFSNAAWEPFGGVALWRRRIGDRAGIHGGDAPGTWWFSLHSDGNGWNDLIIDGGGFRDRFPEDSRKCSVRMNGANVFNFAITRVPPLIEETLRAAGVEEDSVDYFILHQSNRFIMRHLAGKAGISEKKMPVTMAITAARVGLPCHLRLQKGGWCGRQESVIAITAFGLRCRPVVGICLD